MFGILNIYKPKGKTSHDVVSILRRVTKVRQIGHTGTLDPFAEGVLPVCIGKATRLIEYLDDDKAYVGTVKLGSSTSTYDVEGEVVESSDKVVSLEEVENAIEGFRGEIEQMPPIYSAIKVNGKKLYEYARNGEQVEIKPRKVCIEELRVLNFDRDENTLELYIACSKGTYIRSIANDLGEKLGTFGHLIKLVRVKAGSFKVEDAIPLEDLKTALDVENKLLNPLDYISFPKYELTPAEREKVSHGMSFDSSLQNGIVVLTFADELAGVAEVENGRVKCKKVFL